MGQRARWRLPLVVDPDDTLCFQVTVPNDVHHRAAFFGALYDLAKAYSWQNDDAHTAKDVAAVWLRYWEQISECTGGNGVSDDMQFRQNGCKLEYSIDCETWNTLYDPTACIKELSGRNTEPGTIPPGECKEFDVNLQANSRWLFPGSINDGYTIEVTQAAGAWNDGTTAAWKCPDGTPYILGQCVGTKATDSGDPLPSVAHMSLIGIIEAGTPVYFDPLSGIYTVPDGTGQQQLSFQANDSNISTDQGSISFHVKVCATSNSDWTHVFGFILDDGGWNGRGTYSSYVAGQGWADASGALYVQSDHPGDWTLTYVKAVFEVLTPDSQTGGVNVSLRDYVSWGQDVDLFTNNSLFQTGGILEWTGSQAVTGTEGVAFSWSANGGTSAHVRLTEVTLGGAGTDPFI